MWPKLGTILFIVNPRTPIYTSAKSSHPIAQILGIARGVALRLRGICSADYEDFRQKSKEYCKYLIDCGHNRNDLFTITFFF